MLGVLVGSEQRGRCLCRLAIHAAEPSSVLGSRLAGLKVDDRSLCALAKVYGASGSSVRTAISVQTRRERLRRSWLREHNPSVNSCGGLFYCRLLPPYVNY